ncbi:MAG TPA: methyltransferase domain-containing protein [Dongiaceae bacterium]|nr:methyltransferase domain-containing protein [Dongiaceae bacterium]
MALWLHIGGTEAREGWKILNIAPGPYVDFVGDCRSLRQFADSSVERIYACHVYEHLGHTAELDGALKEALRVLVPGGLFQISAPNLEMIAQIIVDPKSTWRDHYFVSSMIFGLQADAHDFHKVGLTHKLLAAYLRHAGFGDIRRVEPFKLFDDWSGRQIYGRLASLNMEARKPASPAGEKTNEG